MLLYIFNCCHRFCIILNYKNLILLNICRNIYILLVSIVGLVAIMSTVVMLHSLDVIVYVYYLNRRIKIDVNTKSLKIK